MPKQVFVDGFNVIRQDPELLRLESGNFYGAQERLIQRLGEYRRGTSHRVTVVFDGTGGPNAFRSRGQKQGVDIVYSSRGETADEVIMDLVGRAGPASGVIVATADSALARGCRSLGASLVSPAELLRHARPRVLPGPAHEYWHGKREEKAWSGSTRKKGNPRRLPKAKRKPSGLW